MVELLRSNQLEEGALGRPFFCQDGSSGKG